MTVRPSDRPRSASERRLAATASETGEVVALRENRLKSVIHPSLRALPDYPAR